MRALRCWPLIERELRVQSQLARNYWLRWVGAVTVSHLGGVIADSLSDAEVYSRSLKALALAGAIELLGAIVCGFGTYRALSRRQPLSS